MRAGVGCTLLHWLLAERCKKDKQAHCGLKGRPEMQGTRLAECKVSVSLQHAGLKPKLVQG